jgi:hypothetical protein
VPFQSREPVVERGLVESARVAGLLRLPWANAALLLGQLDAGAVELLLDLGYIAGLDV